MHPATLAILLVVVSLVLAQHHGGHSQPMRPVQQCSAKNPCAQIMMACMSDSCCPNIQCVDGQCKDIHECHKPHKPDNTANDLPLTARPHLTSQPSPSRGVLSHCTLSTDCAQPMCFASGCCPVARCINKQCVLREDPNCRQRSPAPPVSRGPQTSPAWTFTQLPYWTDQPPTEGLECSTTLECPVLGCPAYACCPSFQCQERKCVDVNNCANYNFYLAVSIITGIAVLVGSLLFCVVYILVVLIRRCLQNNNTNFYKPVSMKVIPNNDA